MLKAYHFFHSASTAKALSFHEPIAYTPMALAGNKKGPLLIGATALAALFLLKRRGRRSLTSLGYLPTQLPKEVYGIPFAQGSGNPAWPLITNHPRGYTVSYRTVEGNLIGSGGRRFMGDRGQKFHAGVDLYGYAGDRIIAMENGKIVNIYHFFHGTYALIVQCDSGLVINYSEIEKNSWSKFGLKNGSRITKGKAIARVGLMSGGGHMLHFETYTAGTERNIRIFTTKPDKRIRNPTEYLLIAKALNEPVAKTVAAALGPDDSIELELRLPDTIDDAADGP